VHIHATGNTTKDLGKLRQSQAPQIGLLWESESMLEKLAKDLFYKLDKSQFPISSPLFVSIHSFTIIRKLKWIKKQIFS
jgi:hypothetical protein